MSQFTEGPSKSLVAAAVLNLYLRAGLNASGEAYLAGANDVGIGTIFSPALVSSDDCTVRLWNAPGTHKMIASGAITLGGLVYPAASGKITATGSIPIGRAMEAAAVDNDVIEVLPLVALSVGVQTVRTRFTIAEINAGASLLPAIPGRRYRLVDAAMIAIGGAAAAATTVDILATQSTASVKLMAAAVAGLTQNTLLLAGATNAAILAGGLSYVANDVNTALTVAKTGSSVTTATHIDVIANYVVE